MRRRWLDTLSGADLLALALLWAAETFVAERHWLATLVTYLPQWPFVAPAALLLLVSLVCRARRAVLINAGALLFGVVALLGFRFAPPPDIPKDRRVLRVMTFNIRHGDGGTERIAAAIRELAPEVICLQEANALGRLPDPKPGLQRALPGYHFAHQGELMVASRYPIRSRRVVPLEELRTRRPALETVLDVGGKAVTVLNVHLATFVTTASLQNRRGRSLPDYLRGTAELRDEQTTALLARAVQTPLIVAGDFNTPPRGRVYQRLTGALHDAFAERGRGFGYTFPARRPMLRIDYLFTSGGVIPVRASVPAVLVSDHRPLMAEVGL
jgi:vancomycin resistance protein VanJ